jgi:hypothetical protein
MVTAADLKNSSALSGSVRDGTGAVLGDAEVQVQHWKSDGRGGTPKLVKDAVLHTDGKGEFYVELPPGLYEVCIFSPSQIPVARKVKVKNKDKVDVNVTLEFSPLVDMVE